MGILSYLWQLRATASAASAKERLQVVLAHERGQRSQPDYLPRLRREILDVIGRYVPIEDDKIRVHYENAGTVSRLELNIEIPSAAIPGAAAS